MRVGRVHVRNIRSYREATLDLGPGTTLLVGDVGSGKTSLLYAIEMALFGAAEIDATYLVRHGAADAEVSVQLQDDGHQYEITRAFRRVRRKGRETFDATRLSYREDGAATAYSATELRQRVIDLLGFRDNPNPRAHSDLWRWAVYVPQERMREILVAPPADRLQTIRKALGVERYRVAAENAKEVARDLRAAARTHREKSDLLARFTEEHARATAEIARLVGDRTRVEDAEADRLRDRDAARGQVTEATRALLSLEAERSELESLRSQAVVDRRLLDTAERAASDRAREIERLRAELGELERRVAERPARQLAWQAAREEAARLRTELEGRTAERAAGGAARARLADLERRTADLARDLRDLTAEAERLASREAELLPTSESVEPAPPTPLSAATIDHELAAARAVEAEASNTLALARRNREELVQLLALGVCPRCGQAVRATEFATHRREAEEAFALSDVALDGASAERDRLERLRSQVELFVRRQEQWRGVRAQLEELSRGRDAVQTALRSAEERIRETAALAEVVRGEVSHAQAREEELGPARARLEVAERSERETRDRWAEADRAASELGPTGARSDRLRDEVARGEMDRALLAERVRARDERMAALGSSLAREAEVRAAAGLGQEHLARVERDLRAASDRRVQLVARLEAAEADRVRAEQGRAERDLLLRTAEEVDEKAAWVAGPFHDALGSMETRVLERAQVDFQRRFQRYFAALVDDPEISATIDREFTPSAEIRGQATPAEALSGGERTSLALAYRFALSGVVRAVGDLRLETLLLDEPTDGFSPEQVQAMGELLGELALPQVVLVSHERELEGIADRVVRVEKEGGRSFLSGPGTGRASASDDATPTKAST